MKKWKRGAGLTLAAAMTLSLMMAGMTVCAFAEEETTAQPVSLFEISAEPLNMDQLKSGTANIGYLSNVDGHSRVYEGENVDCYMLPKGEKLTISAENGVNYQINISEHCQDESGKCFIGDYNGLLMSRYAVKKDGSIEYMRQIDDGQDIVINGKNTFTLPIPSDKSIFTEQEGDLLYAVSIYASREGSSGKTERDNRTFYFVVNRNDSVNKFTDVPADAWYRENVNTACRLELINGRTATTFVPNGDLTYAEAVKLAACMNQKYTEGSVTLVNGSEHWYDTYVSYAKEKGIIDRDYAWNDAATRAGYVEIFANALPAEAFSVKNEVKDGAVPDVAADHPQAEAIYKLYRAGILNGNDKEGTFKPDNSIRRCEVAAILTRMMDPNSRVEVSL